MPPVCITVPATIQIGQTVDARVGGKPARVTMLAGNFLRIEPDSVCAVMFVGIRDGLMNIYVKRQ
jgi:hypothetical protein